eukprot:jgi/Mesen1/2269/ME000154S01438
MAALSSEATTLCLSLPHLSLPGKHSSLVEISCHSRRKRTSYCVFFANIYSSVKSNDSRLPSAVLSRANGSPERSPLAINGHIFAAPPSLLCASRRLSRCLSASIGPDYNGTAINSASVREGSWPEDSSFVHSSEQEGAAGAPGTRQGDFVSKSEILLDGAVKIATFTTQEDARETVRPRDVAGTVGEVSGGGGVNPEVDGRGGGDALARDRFQVVMAAAVAFVICNMDKVNMSIAIIPMAEQLGWDKAVQGYVQASFFWGYALSQLPGGWLAQRFTGRCVGLGEGMAPPAATDLVARTMPKNERSRSVATIFGGLNVGSVLGLLLAPVCITHFGWPSVFYIFGVAGLAWVVAFGAVPEVPEIDAATSLPHDGASSPNGAPGAQNGAQHGSAADVGSSLGGNKNDVPWGAFLKSPAVLALIFAHFCNDWGKYSLQSWLPSFYRSELHFSIETSSYMTILYSLASVGLSAVAALSADNLISRGTDVTQVRKLCQSVAFLAPAAAMAAVAVLGAKARPWVVVALLTAGMSFSSFALAGLYCTHQDISPKYAGLLLGLTNTAGAVPGFVANILTGNIYERTKSWNLALWAPSIFFYIAGTIVWNIFASSRPQDFDEQVKEKFT